MSRTKMGYWEAVVWIAENDEPSDRDHKSIELYMSVALVADIFGKEGADVAFDVYMYRIGARNRFTARFNR